MRKRPPLFPFVLALLLGALAGSLGVQHLGLAQQQEPQQCFISKEEARGYAGNTTWLLIRVERLADGTIRSTLRETGPSEAAREMCLDDLLHPHLMRLVQWRDGAFVGIDD